MFIQSILLHGIRNLKSQGLDFSPSFNFFQGENGAGKTSLLEAIYLLGTGHSFLTHHMDKVISHGENFLKVQLCLVSENNLQVPLKVIKNLKQPLQAYIGENKIERITEIAKMLPLQLMTQESYQLVDDGPRMRRSFLDQGAFYLDANFWEHWRNFSQVLKQYNALLKQEYSGESAQTWVGLFAEYGEALTHSREIYVEKLTTIWQEILQSFFPHDEFKMILKRGWSEEMTLLASLEKHQVHDIQQGHAGVGPHRAELQFLFNGVKAQDVLSRGQKKLLIYSLRFAQSMLLDREKSIKSIYLIDEMPAELDKQRRQLVVDFLLKLDAQVFLTGTHFDDILRKIEQSKLKMFHVKHGEFIHNQ